MSNVDIPQPAQMRKLRINMAIDFLLNELARHSPSRVRKSLVELAKVVVLSPEELDIIAEAFHAAGWNVMTQNRPQRMSSDGEFIIAHPTTVIVIEEPTK